MFKRKFRFEKVEIGDLVKFKILDKYLAKQDTIKYVAKQDTVSKEVKYLAKENKTYSVYYGRVVETNPAKESDHFNKEWKTNEYLTVHIDQNDKRLHYPIGLPIYIDRRSVLQIYHKKHLDYLTPRLALKHLWKDLIFREVKTTKYNKFLYAEYKYISKTGFERIKKFDSMEAAYSAVLPEYHRNIVAYYEDYFGFTKNKALRSNDIYYDKEIFLSKKCYCELDWSANPTGDFLVNEKGFNLISPSADSLICGIVENGEKGLFFRKWFICSKEFLTLWTMVCEPTDCSLFEQSGIIDDDVLTRLSASNIFKSSTIKSNNIWVKKEVNKKKKKIKDLDALMEELDTSCYSVNMNLSTDERRKKHQVYNLERCALYFPNRYKQIAQVLFHRGVLNSEEAISEDFSETVNYTSFQKKLLRNIMWSKKIL